MGAGRKPLPTKVKELRGGRSTYHRAMSTDEPQPPKPPKLPPPPRHLDGIAKWEWKKVGQVLFAGGLLTKVDLTAFGSYCVYYSQWRQAKDHLEKHGMLIKTQAGLPMVSPYWGIMNRANVEMRKWLVEFGMTPSSRSRLKIEKPKAKNPLDDFISKGKKLAAVKK